MRARLRTVPRCPTVSRGGRARQSRERARRTASSPTWRSAPASRSAVRRASATWPRRSSTFCDGTSALWLRGHARGQAGGRVHLHEHLHGGQETTLVSMMLPLLHHGMLIVGLPYTEPALMHHRERRHALRREPRRRRGVGPSGRRDRERRSASRSASAWPTPRGGSRDEHGGRRAPLPARASLGRARRRYRRSWAGYPFGSVVPFVCDHASARPVILISALAEHTQQPGRPIRARACSCTTTPTTMQAGPRLTLARRCGAVRGRRRRRARYLRRFPAAQQLLALGDFSFWRLAPTAAALHRAASDASTGSTPPSFAPPPNALAEAESEIVAHMNADHADALRGYCRHVPRRHAGRGRDDRDRLRRFRRARRRAAAALRVRRSRSPTPAEAREARSPARARARA